MYKYLLSTNVGGFWRYSDQSLELGTLVERYYDEANNVHEVGIITDKKLIFGSTDTSEMNEIAPLDLPPYELTTTADYPNIGKAVTYTLQDGTEFYVYWLHSDIRCHFVDSAETAVAHVVSMLTENFFARAEREFGV